MSSKINVLSIISGHFKTLRSGDRLSLPDIVTFIVMPVALGLTPIFFDLSLNKDILPLLINFGAIFTALLLSVLILVYDQELKLEEKKDTTAFYSVKKRLLRQLYYNISYSILCSVFLVILCLVHTMVAGMEASGSIFSYEIFIKYDSHIFTPLVVTVAVNLFLNILMIVKRMHALLVAE